MNHTQNSRLLGIFLFLVLICSVGIHINAQNLPSKLRSPIDIPILLSGNFGELRSNHFHSGIDFKTQGVVGKPIYAVNDGYISRISVSPYGYGYALYINHPDSLTTVYGHLLQFNDSIAAYVKSQQYAFENFAVDLKLQPNQFPVKKGEQIARSGNSGSSGGPHLHFEVRYTPTEEVVDPIFYYLNQIKDSSAPRIQSIKIYPIPGKGTVNGSANPIIIPIHKNENGTLSMNKTLDVWGEIGFAIKASDYMDQTNNIYGVKKTTLKVDNATLFHADITEYRFDETRYLNALIDYPEWINNKSFFTKSFVEAGNRLRFIEAKNQGILTVNEVRTYQLTYQLTDAAGNQTTLRFNIQGKMQPIEPLDTFESTYFNLLEENHFGAKGLRLTIPSGNLYSDLYFKYSVTEDSAALAGIHKLHDIPVALHQSGKLSLRLQHDTLENKQQYGVIKIDKGHKSWLGGVYRRNGWIDANIKQLGSYSIGIDNTPPTITPTNVKNWAVSKTITFKITDNLSGIKNYRAEIDNQFALFTHDGKTATIAYKLPKSLQNKTISLKLSVVDGCGNETLYSKQIDLVRPTPVKAKQKTKTTPSNRTK